ncbi:FAD-dependent monooxygenase [Trinickia caryophylli]|uniref:2-polyprenyl-6-methoxyphenol hydroxylase n=1 Tax=Trinickia caryophylli TaxID=28094 RepID=A0A1X7G3B2_TRICW|nr:FAD-dependent monooxygenase [Trinickia caryophylli]PMS13745.1 FAD-binding monooxygenase [Trinickia caryophylli]TRX14243.1 FAD-binding monooxygenase [Trinickia caryophylli]WQE14071.1 FAD-dependent monooxygenase [Trinickia caryophylli]SMF63349.1 2-polyprenyl-6-methoxyphenol hydroxylase [Trinickia caryophylli]GLU33439.1 FAD-binding monooxygenase [Trinickia caryophylli]
MKQSKKILICGGGIAGPACAWWLNKYGFSVVVVEKHAAFRDGGQNIDVKGVGQQVIDLMGLTEQVDAHNTHECGQKWLDEAGKALAVFPKGAFGSLTSDFEILRGDFARVLFDATRSTCEYRFGTSVRSIEEREDGVRATFVDGSAEEFELMICADGLNSSTRDLVLAEETRLRYLGAYMAFFDIPRRPEDDFWACSFNGVGGTMAHLRPGGPTQTTVLITFPVNERDLYGPSAKFPRNMLHAALEGRGTLADRIAGELDGVDDFYFGPMSQVQASAWSKGRVVLLGDAAHCPTPFTGKGTALALIGAYVLAGEIKHGSTHTTAFQRYESILRPYVERSQQELSPGLVRLMHVKTRFGISVVRIAQRFFGSALIQALLKPSAATSARKIDKDFALPVY